MFENSPTAERRAELYAAGKGRGVKVGDRAVGVSLGNCPFVPPMILLLHLLQVFWQLKARQLAGMCGSVFLWDWKRRGRTTLIAAIISYGAD